MVTRVWRVKDKLDCVGREAGWSSSGVGRNTKLTEIAFVFTEDAESVEQTSSWHTIFAYGQAIERLQNLQKG